MNYNSIQEILSAGTNNMEIIRNNSKQDDGTDQITGVSWFNYNGTIASNIYVSGNSFIGFGSSVEHLKVNRRDGALYSLYREEGTLFDYYKFLKIRWKGYSQYNQTSTSYLVEYDVILWDTGDISLHMVNIPASNNNGIYSLVSSSTYSYTVSSSSPDVTFIKTDTGFTVSNSLINLIPPYYLVRSGSTYYTVTNDNLTNIEIAELTSSTFQTLGVNVIPNLSLLADLDNPEILYWTNDNNWQPSVGLVVECTPPLPQIVYCDTIDITGHAGIKNVECIESNNVLFSVSIDDGQTWKYYNNGTWNTVATDLDGMDSNTLKSITPTAWSECIVSSTAIKFRCALTTKTSNVGKIYIKYN